MPSINYRLTFLARKGRWIGIEKLFLFLFGVHISTFILRFGLALEPSWTYPCAITAIFTIFSGWKIWSGGFRLSVYIYKGDQDRLNE